ncbi:hypothetical protein C8Q79DRAFT_348136 [Trametes meyenii]|nr:hypothetical protein C8Q79DRAFT_348136 [Trametes meyenii]
MITTSLAKDEAPLVSRSLVLTRFLALPGLVPQPLCIRDFTWACTVRLPQAPGHCRRSIRLTGEYSPSVGRPSVLLGCGVYHSPTRQRSSCYGQLLLESGIHDRSGPQTTSMRARAQSVGILNFAGGSIFYRTSPQTIVELSYAGRRGCLQVPFPSCCPMPPEAHQTMDAA